MPRFAKQRGSFLSIDRRFRAKVTTRCQCSSMSRVVEGGSYAALARTASGATEVGQ